MKFGIGLPTGMEGLINPIPFFRPGDFLAMARLAEDLGYDSVWGNDHYPRRTMYSKPTGERQTSTRSSRSSQQWPP